MRSFAIWRSDNEVVIRLSGISDAISELIDNSIQATADNDGARIIKVQMVDGGSEEVRTTIVALFPIA